MKELVKVNYENDRPTVSARDLYEFLGVGSEYSHWFKRMCEYGFNEGVDFSPFLTESSGGRPAQDAQLTIEMAKEICMLQRNEKGKQTRLYFIQLEKEWNSPERVMARALRFAELELASLTAKIEEDAPKVLFADTVIKSSDNILMRDMAKLLCDNDVNIGEKRLYKLLRDKGILMSDNTPYQSSINNGYFFIKETTFQTVMGQRISKTTLVTPAGQIWLISKVKEWLEGK